MGDGEKRVLASFFSSVEGRSYSCFETAVSTPSEQMPKGSEVSDDREVGSSYTILLVTGNKCHALNRYWHFFVDELNG